MKKKAVLILIALQITSIPYLLAQEIGEHYANGIVFYLDDEGGGLVAGLSDYVDIRWSNALQRIGTSSEVGKGRENTDRIVNEYREGNYAAFKCYDIGYSRSWYLPSEDELQLMYENLFLRGLGGFERANYWSSTESSGRSYASVLNFYTGRWSGGYKNDKARVRPIRSFQGDPTKPHIGHYYAGGIVFYLDGSGGGLVVAPIDQDTKMWWGGIEDFGRLSYAIGAGGSNTQAIVNRGGSRSAAGFCNDLELNGYDDWFLPSKNELNLIYENLHKARIGGFENWWYWSSSQKDSWEAWVLHFGNGTQRGMPKGGSYFVRPVRAF